MSINVLVLDTGYEDIVAIPLISFYFIDQKIMTLLNTYVRYSKRQVHWLVITEFLAGPAIAEAT